MLLALCEAGCPSGRPLPKVIGADDGDTIITAFDFRDDENNKAGLVAGETNSAVIFENMGQNLFSSGFGAFIQIFNIQDGVSIPKEYLFDLNTIRAIKWGIGSNNDRFIALTEQYELA